MIPRIRASFRKEKQHFLTELDTRTQNIEKALKLLSEDARRVRKDLDLIDVLQCWKDQRKGLDSKSDDRSSGGRSSPRFDETGAKFD